MKRLTGRDAKGVYYIHGDECGVHPYADRPNIEHRVAIERLAAYEDAEERGRLVVLPCKVGDTVWVIPTRENGMDEVKEMECCGFSISAPENVANCFGKVGTKALFQPSFDDFGKTVFLTREAAETALNAEKGNV